LVFLQTPTEFQIIIQKQVMKTQSLILSFFTILFISTSVFAQKTSTETIKVWGNCGMCKKTIETAAKEAGATEANWSTETKVLTVAYGSGSTNQKVQKAIAAAGYDTQDLTAPDEAYNKLHECCKYDRKNAPKGIAVAKMDKCCDGKDCCKDGKCTMGADCCKEGSNCCKDGKCMKAGDCCKDMAACCKDGKCEKCVKGEKGSKTMADCCKDMTACKDKGCCKA
jgi:hypothetical protein